jgi:hypothetical protein
MLLALVRRRLKRRYSTSQFARLFGIAMALSLAGCGPPTSAPGSPEYERMKANSNALVAKIDAQNAAHAAYRQAHDKMPPATIGMTADQVRNETLFGAPDYINKTVAARGIYEQWVYRGSIHTTYYYFLNGILTSIETTGG